MLIRKSAYAIALGRDCFYFTNRVLTRLQCLHVCYFCGKDFIFCELFFRSTSGGEYLFQAKDDDEMHLWVRAIQEVSQGDSTASGPSRAQTLPVSSGEKKDEPKKRGFFTLKKK